jgi:uncharacterized protein
VKLVWPETESDALADWLDARVDTPRLTSVLTEAELPRALRRIDPRLAAGAPAVLAHVARYEMDEPVRSTAAAYQAIDLRSLDAIHLATAQVALGSKLTSFVSYDHRLLAAAVNWGLPVVQPG